MRVQCRLRRDRRPLMTVTSCRITAFAGLCVMVLLCLAKTST
jgi:hypothetical protein